MTRISRDEYFMQIAEACARRSTCDRARVGAVIVHENIVLGTGFNGSLPGEQHCDDVGHDMRDGHCVRTIHAELNAVHRALLLTNTLEGTTIYCTHMPCFYCYRMLKVFGITRIVAGQEYRGANPYPDVEVLGREV